MRCDFEKAVELLTIPEFREHILRLMLSVNVTNIRDYYAIFEKVKVNGSRKKHHENFILIKQQSLTQLLFDVISVAKGVLFFVKIINCSI